MTGSRRRQQLAGVLVLCAVSFCGLPGCQNQKKNEDGKTYTPDSQGKQGGSQAGGGAGQGDPNKPLNEPADTVNGKESAASDSGSSAATRGQPIAEPGAPVEHHQSQKPHSPPSTLPPGGHS